MFHPKHRKPILWTAIILLALLCLFLFWKGMSDISGAKNKWKTSPEIAIDQKLFYPVTDVLDGDTFKVKINNKTITVRLLGVDTPETVDPSKPAQCFGPEASDQTKTLLSGHSVRLVFETKRERRDKYGRYLVYAYRDDGLFLNETLLQSGFAREYTYGSAYSFQLHFRKTEQSAMANSIGLWSACGK